MMTSTADIQRIFVDTSAWIDLMNKIALVQSRPDIDAIFAFDHHMILAGRPVLPGLLE